MEKTDFDRKVLDKIKEDKLKPVARRYFVLKNYLVWAIGVLALLASSAALAVMTYLFQFNDFALRREINKSTLEILFLTLPYFWIIFLAAAIFIVYYNVKHTKTGYRYPFWLVTVVVFSASIILGALFSSFGWDEKLDETLARRAPLYGTMINPHVDFWSNPEEGRLVGLATSEVEGNIFNLIDRDGNVWLVYLRSETEGKAVVVSGYPIRLLGNIKDKMEFEADMVLPLMPGKGYFRGMHTGPRGEMINATMTPGCFEGGCRFQVK